MSVAVKKECGIKERCLFRPFLWRVAARYRMDSNCNALLFPVYCQTDLRGPLFQLQFLIIILHRPFRHRKKQGGKSVWIRNNRNNHRCLPDRLVTKTGLKIRFAARSYGQNKKLRTAGGVLDENVFNLVRVVAAVQRRAKSRLGITSVATGYDCKTGRQRRRILDEKCREEDRQRDKEGNKRRLWMVPTSQRNRKRLLNKI